MDSTYFTYVLPVSHATPPQPHDSMLRYHLQDAKVPDGPTHKGCFQPAAAGLKDNTPQQSVRPIPSI
jgi:hypothetical protein